MTTNLDARNLVLKDVHRLLNLERQLNSSFTSLLDLESLTEVEQQRLAEIRHNFDRYYEEGKVLEGEVKFLFLSPLMWLSGFYSPNIRISLEEGITDIDVEDEDLLIKGRIDVLAATSVEFNKNLPVLWILLIESKRMRFDASVGLPQLLTYSYTCLENQDAVWGLTTNGKNYQFVYLEKGNLSTYQLLPELDLIRPDNAITLLQVLKAICKPYLI